MFITSGVLGPVLLKPTPAEVELAKLKIMPSIVKLIAVSRPFATVSKLVLEVGVITVNDPVPLSGPEVAVSTKL